MRHSTDFQSLSSDSAEQYENKKTIPTNIVSILKHIPAARKVLEGHNYEKQITKCKYNQQLVNNPGFIMPKNDGIQNNRPNAHSRLVELDQAQFQHNVMKEKIKNVLERQESEVSEFVETLWSVYGGQQPVYARFGNKMRKNNFANNLLQINDVNIQIGPRLKAERTTKTQTKQFTTPSTVRFQSNFQSGNLMYAYRNPNKQIQTYDLILQNDINTRGHNQWFYFKITNTKKHNKIRLHIQNFIKQQSMFSYGIKPLTFSQRAFNTSKVGWHRSGQKIHYHKNKMKRENNTNKSYYTLSFDYYFMDVDQVYFASCYPYTHTQLLNYYDLLMEKHLYDSFIAIKPLVESIGGNRINVVTVGSGRKEMGDCRVVWVIARQHPGETIGSFMAEGMIDYLLEIYNQYNQYSQINNNKNKKTTKQDNILDQLIFKIVPMVNVDGVIHGNTRTNIAGVDPNRMWKKNIKRLCPEISALKKLILTHKENIAMILDLHSHSKKLGCFFYGNTIRDNPKSSKLYPSLVCQSDKKQRFSTKSGRYRGGYPTTARNVLFSQLQIPSIYTVQCSLLGYLKSHRIIQYSIADYHQMGKILLQTFINLQKQRISQKQAQIIQETIQRGIQIDTYDCQSARSQSSLSDEQYKQVRCKNPTKIFKKKPKKSEAENSLIAGKNVISTNNKKQMIKISTKNIENIRGQSANSYKSPRSMVQHKNKHLYDISLNIYINENHKKQSLTEKSTKYRKSILQQNNPQQKSLPMKIPKINRVRNRSVLNTNQNINQSILPQKIKINNSYQQQRNHSNLRNNSAYKKLKINQKKLSVIEEENKVDVGVQVIDNGEQNYRYTPRTEGKQERYLCVVGNSLEDQTIDICGKQIGVQFCCEMSANNASALKKIQQQKPTKIQRILTSLCPNMSILDDNNPIFNTNPRRLAPLPHKKGNLKT